MANNRLWAVCTVCNSATVVLKYYPCDWYHVNTETEWFREHGQHHEDCMTGEEIMFVTEEDKRIKGWDISTPIKKIYLKEND